MFLAQGPLHRFALRQAMFPWPTSGIIATAIAVLLSGRTSPAGSGPLMHWAGHWAKEALAWQVFSPFFGGVGRNFFHSSVTLMELVAPYRTGFPKVWPYESFWVFWRLLANYGFDVSYRILSEFLHQAVVNNVMFNKKHVSSTGTSEKVALHWTS